MIKILENVVDLKVFNVEP